MKLKRILMSFMTVIIVFIQAFVAISVTAENTEIDAPNLIKNSGFEEGVSSTGNAVHWWGGPDWQFRGTMGTGYGVNVVEGRNGTRGGSWWQSDQSMVGQAVEVTPGHRYRLSFWYKNNPKFPSKKLGLSILDGNNRDISFLDDVQNVPSSWDNTLGLLYKKAEIYKPAEDWTEIVKEFDSEDSTLISIEFSNVSGTGNGKPETVFFDDVSLIDLGETPPIPGEIKNTDFSKGLKNWDFEKATVSDGIVKLESTAEKGCASISQRVFVKPNTDYTITYSYKNIEGSNTVYVLDDSSNIISTPLQNNKIDIENDKLAVYNFNSGENEYVTVKIVAEEDENSLVYIDDVKMTSGNIIVNGDFEKGNKGWILGGSWAVAKGTNKKPALSGEKSLKNKGGIQYTEAKQPVPVEPNTEYTLSYKYSANKNGWLIVKLDNEPIKHYEGKTSGEGEDKYSFVTKSNQTKLEVIFMGANGEKDDLMIDDVSLVKTIEKLNVKKAKVIANGNQANFTVILSNSKEFINGDLSFELYGEDGKTIADYEEKDIRVSGSYVINTVIDIPLNTKISNAKVFVKDEKANILAEAEAEINQLW